MEQQNYQIIKPVYKKRRKRVGCGPSSGNGKTCGRGMNGQKCRSGSTRRAWFEGGQMPLQRRVPKRGFNNFSKKEYQIINVSIFEKLDLNDVNPDILKDKGIIKSSKKRVKVLGNGTLNKKVNIAADSFSKTAIEKIKKAGGDISIRKFPPLKVKDK